MDDLVSQIKTLAVSADATQKSEMVNTLRNLANSLENTRESMERIAYSPLQLFGAKIAKDLQVLQQLAGSSAPLSVEQLAEPSSADLALLKRVMRYLASVGMVDEPSTHVFAANNITNALGSPSGLSYIDVFYEIASPSFYELPKFLASTKYKNPTEGRKVPFQQAFNFEGDFFSFLDTHRDKLVMYNRHMQLQKNSPTDWPKLLSVVKEVESTSPDELFFSDVGGGSGYQVEELRNRYPEAKGRFILQDLGHVIGMAGEIPGVEKFCYNIFEPQHINNARFYYLRGVLHTFPDEACEKILRNQVQGLGPDSKLLIEELVLPEAHVNWSATCIDMLMLSSFASQERTRSQWVRLLERSGLKVVDIHTYSPGPYESLIVAVKAGYGPDSLYF
ncbi:S-adenosyl-L-methionine-dependent methyltransferase [Aspergillus floccosus]